MLYKIKLFVLSIFLFSSSLSAEDNETFAHMACGLITNNRFVLHCELQQGKILFIQTTDGKELRILCVWFPQTRECESRLDDAAISLGKKVDNVLIGYGQTARNPMFYYYLPEKKISKKMKVGMWEEYRIPLSLCDFQFK